jgi:hypothetical protein
MKLPKIMNISAKLYMLLILSLTFEVKIYSQSNNWDLRFCNPTINFNVNDIFADETGLYVAGEFTAASGNPKAAYVAKWNGTYWENLGNGLNNTVRSIRKIDGQIYIGGDFTNAGDDPDADYVAKLNSNTQKWEAVGAGLTGSVYSVRKFALEDIVVVGTFTNVLGDEFNSYLLVWDKSENKWTKPRKDTLFVYPSGGTLYTGVNSWVFTAENEYYLNNNYAGLVIGGNFHVMCDWDDSIHIAFSVTRFRGGDWEPFENRDTVISGEYPQINQTVFSVAVDEPSGYLIGGNFINAGAVQDANNILYYHDGHYIPLGSGTNGPVYTVALTDRYYYAGGNFTKAGDINVKNFARYNRQLNKWEPITPSIAAYDIPFNGDVNKIVVVNDSLIYVAGKFKELGGIKSNDYFAVFDGKSWKSLGLGLVGEPVMGIEVLDNKIYVAGGFLDADSKHNNDYFVTFNSIGYESVGNIPLNGVVTNLYKDGNELILFGYFNNAGGLDEADFIVKWNGTEYLPLGPNSAISQIGNVVKSIVKYNGKYLLGGFFESLNNQNIKFIAEYDGVSWKQFGVPLNNYVYGLKLHNNELYAYGAFKDASNNNAADYVAKWDGTKWVPVVGSFNDGSEYPVVNSILIDNGGIYVSGYFSNLGNNPNADNIAFWDGQQWKALGIGLNGNANKMVFKNNKVLAAGNFTSVNNNENINNIAMYDGTDWSAVTVPSFIPGSEIYDFEFFENNLLIGGNFNTLTDYQTSISKFGIYNLENTPLPVDGEEFKSKISFYLFQNYPNPFNPYTTIKFMIPNSGIIKLKIFDILGNEVDELYSGYKNAGLHSLTFNGSNLASGVYFYQLQFENSIITKKLLLLK